jgi:hypothetical protein
MEVSVGSLLLFRASNASEVRVSLFSFTGSVNSIPEGNRSIHSQSGRITKAMLFPDSTLDIPQLEDVRTAIIGHSTHSTIVRDVLLPHLAQPEDINLSSDKSLAGFNHHKDLKTTDQTRVFLAIDRNGRFGVVRSISKSLNRER